MATAATLVAMALGVLASGCGRSAPAAIDRLRPCSTTEAPPDAYCGTLRVFEDRDAAAGRRIDLNIVVLPALGSNPRPDPLFFLAGGPGQGAAQMGREVRGAFRAIQRERDIVLIDQRGTGKSHPLDCEADTNTLAALTESDERAVARLRGCLAGYDADVRLYTTPVAMDDLDEVRAYLGYDRVNLYGGSYGTRAALVYLRRHAAHVRAIVLDGVAPPNMRLPLFVGRDAERALDRMLADCAADAGCNRTFPGLGARVHTLFERLAAAPRRVTLIHPRTGVAEEVDVSARFVAGILFGALYSPLTASVLPELLARAERDDFQGLVALALASESSRNMSTGMQLSVVCSEDVPRIDRDARAAAAREGVFRAALFAGQLAACEGWPRGQVDAAYYEPIVSDVPALILSGELDPITPPSWGEEVVRHLSHGRHIIAPGTGHGVIGSPCGPRAIAEFIERGDAAAVGTGCFEALRRPPFFLAPSGPEPGDPSSRATAQ